MTTLTFEANAGDAPIKLTRGALRNSNICVRTITHLLPGGLIGGPSRDTLASNRLAAIFDPEESVKTDIAGNKVLF